MSLTTPDAVLGLASSFFSGPTRQQRNAPLSGDHLIVIVRITVKLSPNFLTGTFERSRSERPASIAAWNINQQILLDRFMDRVPLTSRLDAT